MLTISTNLRASDNILKDLNSLPTNLELPPIEFEEEDADNPAVIWYCRKAPTERTILKIYLGYKTCSLNKPRLIEALEIDRKIFEREDRIIDLHDRSLEIQSEFGNNMYELAEYKNKEIRTEKRKGKIQIIILGTSAGVVGVLVGFLIGAFAL